MFEPLKFGCSYIFVLVLTGCSILTDPVNGLVDTEMGTTFGSIATYYCLPGYDLIGTRNRVCGVSGEWEGSPPFCQGVGRFI